MDRGILKTLSKTFLNANTNKEWLITLQECRFFWYELIVNGHEEIDTKKIIFAEMKQQKKEVEGWLEKRFIYFICSRKKVRFSTRQTPSIDSEGNIEFNLEIGKEREIRKICMVLLWDRSGAIATKAEIDSTGRFISFTNSSEDKISYSIHDFLHHCGINLGIESVVQYVGYTKNPNSRPLDGKHGGLSEVLYNVSNEENDFIFVFNLFSVYSKFENRDLNGLLANSMTDEIQVDKEGQVIEKCFILYFDSKNQSKNKEKEKREIENDLLQLAQENNITSVVIEYEFNGDSEYYKFSSSSILAKQRHLFTASLKGGELHLEEGANFCEEYGQI